MKLPRRKFLHLAAGATALPAVSRIASADTYPSRPVRFIVGFPAGNASDVLARLMGQGFSDQLAQNVVVENRRAPAVMSALKRSCERRRMATLCS
jgi:tripartite-type tricarboxylate transporter receptor subunit TctC